MRPLKLFTGSSNPLLCHAVAKILGIEVSDAEVRRFSDGEVYVALNESVRDHDVFLLQSTSYPGNDNLMELMLMADACRRASAARVNVVAPYLGYCRQDRQVRPRVPISAKVVANMLASVGVSRVITIDIHAAQIQFPRRHRTPVAEGNVTGLSRPDRERDRSMGRRGLAGEDWPERALPAGRLGPSLPLASPFLDSCSLGLESS